MTHKSPDIFPTAPERGTGVRRLNRRPLMFLMAAFALVMAAIGYTLNDRAQEASVGASEPESFKPVAESVVTDNAQEAGLIEMPVEEDALASEGPIGEIPAASPPPTFDVPPSDAQPVLDEQTQRAQERWEAIEQRRIEAAAAAIGADSSVESASGFAATSGEGLDMSGIGGLAGAGPNANPLAQLDRLAAGLASQAGAAGGGGADPNRAAEKAAWLQSARSSTDYLDAKRTAPISEFEIKAGAVLPMNLLFGANSDLPGQLRGQVRENVYDSIHGREILIPQGTVAIGTYDNHVTPGQNRLLAAWNRLIFPDGSSLDLGGMPGADQSGAAGLTDQVDRHTFRLFGNALLFSLFSAGVQLSQPDSGSDGNAYDSRQVMAAALGQQLGQTGMQLIQKNMNIQDTLKLRPGLRFNIVVVKDMVLPPYRMIRS